MDEGRPSLGDGAPPQWRRRWGRRAGWVSALALLGVVLVAVWLTDVWRWNSVPEPVIAGRPAGDYFPFFSGPGTNAAPSLPPSAVGILVANHLPWVLAEIDREPSPLHGLMSRYRDKLPGFIRQRLPSPLSPEDRRSRLHIAIYERVIEGGIRPAEHLSGRERMGTRSTSLFIRYVGSGYGPKSERAPGTSGAEINGFPELRAHLQHRDPEVRFAAAVAVLMRSRRMRGADVTAAVREAIGVVRGSVAQKEGDARDWIALAGSQNDAEEHWSEMVPLLRQAMGFVEPHAAGFIAYRLALRAGPKLSLADLIADSLARGDAPHLSWVLCALANLDLDHGPMVQDSNAAILAAVVSRVLESPLASSGVMREEGSGSVRMEFGDLIAGELGVHMAISMRSDQSGVMAGLKLFELCGTNGAGSAAFLGRYFVDPEERVRVLAAQALAAAGPGAQVDMEGIVGPGLRDPAMREHLLRWVAMKGTDARVLLPAMLPLMRVKDPRDRVAVYRVAMKIAPGDPRLWPEMKRGLKDPEVRLSVVRGLAQFGERVEEVREELEALAEDASGSLGMDEIRREARRVLGKGQ